jgi:hypothetical protein
MPPLEPPFFSRLVCPPAGRSSTRQTFFFFLDYDMNIQVTDKEAFLEQQQKLTEAARMFTQVQTKLSLIEREKKRIQFTLKELAEMPAETPTYRSIGTLPLSLFLQL